MANSRMAVTVVLALLVGLGLAAAPVAGQSGGEAADGEAGPVTVETDNGTTLVVDAVLAGGDAKVSCVEDGGASYCDKSGNLTVAGLGLAYEGYNRYDPAGPTGGFADTFALELDGERVGSVEASSQDNPLATLVGRLGGIGFGLFG